MMFKMFNYFVMGLLPAIIALLFALAFFAAPTQANSQELNPEHVVSSDQIKSSYEGELVSISNVVIEKPPVKRRPVTSRAYIKHSKSEIRRKMTVSQYLNTKDSPTYLESWKERYGPAVIKASNKYDIPPNLLMAVIATESGYRAYVTGSNGEIGLSQLKLNTARSVGYNGTRKALYDPVTNISVGAKYLSIAYKKSGGNTCRAASLYNQGIYSKRINVAYCNKVQRAMGKPANRIV